MLLASKFTRPSSGANLGKSCAGMRCFDRNLSPFLARNYAKAESTKQARGAKSDDRVEKAKTKLSSIEKKIAADLKEVKKNPKTPPIPEEDKKSPISVQKRLSSIARSTAQKMIRREIKKVAQSAAIDLELPKSAIGAKTKVKVHTNTKSDTPVESLAPTPAATSIPANVRVPPEELKQMLEKLNAQDVVILDVRQKCNWASFFLVASSPSTKQLQGISESLIYQINKKYPRVKPTADAHDEWIAVDLDTVVIHLMLPRTRRYYKIEQTWTEMLPLSKQQLLDADEEYQASQMLPEDYEEEPEPEYRIVDRKYTNEVDEDDEEGHEEEEEEEAEVKPMKKPAAKPKAEPVPIVKAKNVKTTLSIAGESASLKPSKPAQSKKKEEPTVEPDDALVEELFGPVDGQPPVFDEEAFKKKEKPLTPKQIKHSVNESGRSDNHTTAKRATKPRQPKSAEKKEEDQKEIEELVQRHEVVLPKRTVHKKSHRLPEAAKQSAL